MQLWPFRVVETALFGSGGVDMKLRVAAIAALAISACSSPPRPAGELRTMSELVDGARANDPEALAAVTLRGETLRWLSEPYGTSTQTQESDRDGLVVQPAYADARPAAFVTTEIWDGFPRVWAQPLYVLVTGFDPVNGPVPVPNTNWIFAFGAGSRFYSPYWQTWYVTVPGGFPVESLRSAEDVVASGLTLTQGPLRYATIGPREVEVAHTQGQDPVHPFTGDVLLARLPAQGWVDGELTWFVDFGADRFRVNDNMVVQEVALFRFALLGPDGSPQPMDVPPVVGTGPLRTPRAADAPNGFPRFGALRHEYYAMLTPAPGQPKPGVFVSSSQPALREQMIAQLGPELVPVPSDAAERIPERDQFTLRVAIDGSCFTLTDFPQSCVWLDTQQAIENNLPGTAFTDLKRFSSGALVFFDGVAP
jgi:hypothetical protein